MGKLNKTKVYMMILSGLMGVLMIMSPAAVFAGGESKYFVSYFAIAIVWLVITVANCKDDYALFKEIGRYVLPINLVSVTMSIVIVAINIIGKSQILFFGCIILGIVFYILFYKYMLRVKIEDNVD